MIAYKNCPIIAVLVTATLAGCVRERATTPTSQPTDSVSLVESANSEDRAAAKPDPPDHVDTNQAMSNFFREHAIATPRVEIEALTGTWEAILIRAEAVVEGDAAAIDVTGAAKFPIQVSSSGMITIGKGDPVQIVRHADGTLVSSHIPKVRLRLQRDVLVGTVETGGGEFEFHATRDS